MSHDHSALIAKFRETLTQQRYRPVVLHNYCRSADHFLRHLAERENAVEAATPAEVSNYLRAAVRWFRKRRGYSSEPPMAFRSESSNPCVVAARAETVAT